jgi:choline monooxygenase
MDGFGAIAQDEIAQAYEALMRPIGVAEGLPGKFYGEPFYRLEQDRLFARSWCAVAFASQLPNPGDMQPIDLAGWPIVIVRDKDGEIRAFHNVCRHRCIRLVTEPTHRALIRCPWHSWAYSLDGSLVATPEIGGANINEAEGIDRSQLGLKPIRVGRWLDYIFVNLDDQASSFERYIAPTKALLADYELEHLIASDQIKDVYESNWKIAMEGGLEHYHLPFAHPHLSADRFRNGAPCFAPGSYAGSMVDLSKRTGGEATDPAFNARLPALRTRDGQPLPKLYTLNLFPTGTMLVVSERIMLGVMLPDGPFRTNLEQNYYVQPEAAKAPELAQARKDTVDSSYLTMTQDQPFMKAFQEASFTRDRSGLAVRFSPYWEQGVMRFQQLVLEAMG